MAEIQLTWNLFATPVLIAVLGYFVKKWIDGIDFKLDRISREHNECMRRLPVDYARREDVEELSEKVDGLDRRVSYCEGLRNGKAA